MALAASNNRLRDLQRELRDPEDAEVARRMQQRQDAAGMLAEEEMVDRGGPAPGPQIASPSRPARMATDRTGMRFTVGGKPYGATAGPLGDTRLSPRPGLTPEDREGVVAAEGVNQAVRDAAASGVRAVSNFLRPAAAAAADLVKPGRMQEIAKPAADAVESHSRQVAGPDGKRAEEAVAQSDRARQMQSTDPRILYGSAQQAFLEMWNQDEGGAIRTTYTTPDGKPDFNAFIDDMVEPGEDPNVALQRIVRNFGARKGGKDGAGRTVAGYETQVSPREGYTAEEQAQIDSAPKPYVPGASRLPKGVTRPKPYVNDSAGGENAQGANMIVGPGMPAHAERLTDSVDEAMKDEDGQPINAGNGKYVKYPGAHELAEDTGHDMEGSWSPQDVANGRFPTSLDQWAVLLQQNNNPADQEAYIMHLAQQMGFDISGVEEGKQLDAAKRMVAEQMFRYGDAAQKEWAKRWGRLTGPRWHISRNRKDRVDSEGNVIAKKGSPLATQPMRTAAWDPEKGQFVDSATGYARDRAERLQDIAATRQTVQRRAALGPNKQMSAEDIAAEMGQENWDSLTPVQQRAFTGEMERGAKVFDNRVNSARNAEIRAGTDRARGWYNEEMEKATTPFEAFQIARKYGDEQASAYYAQMIDGQNEVAAAAAGARQGDPSPAQTARELTSVRQEAVDAVKSGGSVQAARAVLDPNNERPVETNREIAEGVRADLPVDSMTPQAILKQPGFQGYLQDIALKHPGAMARGDGDWSLGGFTLSQGNESRSKSFADEVIRDLRLPDTPEMRAELDAWWRRQPGVDDPKTASAQPGPSATAAAPSLPPPVPPVSFRP